jgi:hypothetical protein
MMSGLGAAAGQAAARLFGGVRLGACLHLSLPRAVSSLGIVLKSLTTSIVDAFVALDLIVSAL